MTTVVIACFAVLVGAVVRGYTGFGASLFWVASLSLIYSPSNVVPTVLILEVLASLVLLPAVVGHVEWRGMSWMLGATIITMPLGVVLLSVLPEQPMRLVVAGAIFAATIAMAAGANLAGTPGRRTELTAGAVSGVINGCTGLGGPPAVLLYFSGDTEAKVGRATLIAYFLATDAFGSLFMGIGGLIDRPVLSHAVIFAPLALVGIYAGQRAFSVVSDRGFRKVVIVTLLLLSMAMLARATVLS